MRSSSRCPWVGALACALLFAWLPRSSSGQSFGRFGYGGDLRLPGFAVNREGFQASQDSSDRIRFGIPSPTWKPVATSDYGQTVLLTDAPWNPSKIRVNLHGLGFSLYFSHGIQLRLQTPGSPFLSWNEGSVSDRVPTPDLNWIAISFRDRQPPILLAFPDAPASLTVEGSPGNWVIKSAPSYRGWVRVGLPVGLRPVPTNTASALGLISNEVAKSADEWLRPVPELKDLDVTADDDFVTAKWKFDGPGVVVPPSFLKAAAHGYPVKILSGHHQTPVDLGDGPLVLTDEADLTVQFPLKAYPRGRALALGEPHFSFLASAAPQDTQSLIELAVESLYACRDAQTAKLAEETLGEYLSQAEYVREPTTGQMLPYSEVGVGSDAAAAAALLMQAIQTASASDEANALLTSLSVRRDWLTSRFWTLDGKVNQTTPALASIAGALASDPKRRLEAALFHTGLVASGPDKGPLYALRQKFFGKPTKESDFVKLLFSPLRVQGAVGVTLFRSGTELRIKWAALEPKPAAWSFFGPMATLKAQANLARLATNRLGGELTVHYIPEIAGICEATFTTNSPLFLPSLVAPQELEHSPDPR